MNIDSADLIWAIVLGLIQGATEFMPVSSSAHLLLVPRLFGVSNQLLNSLTFALALHLGTAIAIAAAIAPAWISLLRAAAGPASASRHSDRRRLAAVVLATAFTGVAGILLEQAAETVLRSAAVAGSALIIGAVFMYLADRWAGSERPTTFWRLALSGCAQAIALVPGVSRSGAIFTFARWLGLDRRAAIEYAFLLMAPIVIGAAVYRLPDLLAQNLGGDGWILLAAGVASATGSGFLVAKWLPGFVAKHGVGGFCAYRIVIGLIVLTNLL